MSTRWYPLYQRGNPQLRIFLPNFWMKLLKPAREQPPNTVEFACPVEMTRHDIADYLKKIYDIPVTSVRTRVAMGKISRDGVKGYVTKEEQYKIAYITLPKNEHFVFPNLFEKPEEKSSMDEDKMIDESKAGFKKYLAKNKERHGVPAWYSF